MHQAMFIAAKIISLGQGGFANRHMHAAMGALHHVFVGFDCICLRLNSGLPAPRVILNNRERYDTEDQQ